MRPFLFLLCVVGLMPGCANTLHSATHGDFQVHTVMTDYNNVHLVRAPGEDRWLMIDAGLASQLDSIEYGLAHLGIDPASIAVLVITHGHGDHAGTAEHFQSTYGTLVIAGAGDKEMISRAGDPGKLCPTDAIAGWRQEQDAATRYPVFEPDRWVEGELDLAELTGFAVRLVPLPGHTEGSLVVVADDAVFVGDLLRGSIVGSGAVTHFYMCDLADNVADLNTLLTQVAPQAQWFYPGHLARLTRADVEALARQMAAKQ